MYKIVIVIIAILSYLNCISQNIDFSKAYNDLEIEKYIIKKSISLIKKGKTTRVIDLYSQRQNPKCRLKLKTKIKKKQAKNIYKVSKYSTIVVNSIYKPLGQKDIKTCSASGFIIKEDGICVTNAHVFERYNDKKVNVIASTIMDNEGNVYAVEKILATNKKDDIAIFKVKTDKKLVPLSLNKEYNIGDDIFLISHPVNRFYTLTKGIISRYYFNTVYKGERLSIDADFARGSSGGPVIDIYGNVIGIAVSTSHLRSFDNKHQQMVVKDCIPIQKLLNMIE